VLDIVDVAVGAGNFKTLVAAVKAAGLVDTLKGNGPFTVFAPDDEAFAKLPTGTVEGLLKNTPKLKAILLYHVVAGRYMSSEIDHLNRLKTVQGQDVEVDAHKWHLHMNPKINGANITRKDIEADNGVIHVLDQVIMPKMDLICPVCGMGFDSNEDMTSHHEAAHVAAKASEPTPVSMAMPTVEKATEPMTVTEEASKPTSTKEAEGVFEIQRESNGKFHFHLKASNGEIIAQSQSYAAKESAEKGIASIKKNAPIAKVVDMTDKAVMHEPHAGGIIQDPVFEIHCETAGKYHFHLKAGNGQIIASSQDYKQRASAENGIESIKHNAPTAKIVDLTK
jgi:uncharacterized protein YegP (UPF0339 family)